MTHLSDKQTETVESYSKTKENASNQEENRHSFREIRIQDGNKFKHDVPNLNLPSTEREDIRVFSKTFNSGFFPPARQIELNLLKNYNALSSINKKNKGR